MTQITRYSEDDASTFNAALVSLETLYNTIGNVIGTIDQGSLTIDSPEINIIVPAGYRWLQLEVNTYTTYTGADNETANLRLNDDASALYAVVGYYAHGVPVYQRTGRTQWEAVVATAGGIAQFGTTQFTIMPMSSEIVMLGRSFLKATVSGGTNGLFAFRSFGRYTGSGGITSMRFYPSTSSKFISGTYWRLRGVLS